MTTDATQVTQAAYRTADESGSPEAAGTVAWNWISELAQQQRAADAAMTEIVSEPLEGGGRVTRLYRGSTLLAVATTFRDAMNYTVLTRWVAPELQATTATLTAQVEALTARAKASMEMAEDYHAAHIAERDRAQAAEAKVEALREVLEQIANNNWRDQSRAKQVARAALASTSEGEG